MKAVVVNKVNREFKTVKDESEKLREVRLTHADISRSLGLLCTSRCRLNTLIRSPVSEVPTEDLTNRSAVAPRGGCEEVGEHD